ncbi:MAG: hypothetical protein AB8B93_19615 [Pseudomonadales bacterium]
MNRLAQKNASRLLPAWFEAGRTVLAVAALLTLAGCNNDSPSPQNKAAPAAVEPPQVGEQLQILPPNGWQLSASSNRGNFRRARYVRMPTETTAQAPEARSVESLTFEYLDPDGLPDPIQFLEAMAAEQSERCEEFSSRGIGAGLENGYPSAVRLLSCPYRKVNKSSTVSLAKAIAGNNGYYLIVFEKRGPSRRTASGWDTSHVSEDDIASWSLYLRSTKACDTERAEHPCN